MRETTVNTEKHIGSQSMKPEIFISREWFTKTFMSMGDAVIATDQNGSITSMNKVAEELTGYSLSESSGKPIDSIFDAINEHTHLPIENPIKIALKENKALLLSNHTILIKKDKTERYIVDSAVPIHNDSSEIVGGALIFRDVTEQTLSRKKLAETEGMLKESLELIDRLQQKNKDLRQFTYTVLHDLRSPIAKVLGLVSLSAIDPEYKINDKTLLENIANEINDLDSLVKDMSNTISVRDEGKKKEYITFERELNLIKKVLENELAESKAAITADLQNPEGTVTVKSYLYSIMFNLLSNAIKYRSPEVPLNIHLQTRQDKEFICLSVKDNGLGIDMKKNGNRLFELYTRFHGNKIEGKGIGLNLVKAQTESLGGRVEVESEENLGSTFKIFLPITHSEDATD